VQAGPSHARQYSGSFPQRDQTPRGLIAFLTYSGAANASGNFLRAAPSRYNRRMQDDLDRILIPQDALAQRVRELADQIAQTYKDSTRGVVIVPILCGSVIFLADLIRCLPFKMRIGLVTVSSYGGGTQSSGRPRMLQSLNTDIAGRDVLVVDDILDTGNTLRFVLGELRSRDPASLRVCVLLRKKGKAPADLHVDYVGFDIEDVFVVGYGLDYNDLYRNWPAIAVLRPELYT